MENQPEEEEEEEETEKLAGIQFIPLCMARFGSKVGSLPRGPIICAPLRRVVGTERDPSYAVSLLVRFACCERPESQFNACRKETPEMYGGQLVFPVLVCTMSKGNNNCQNFNYPQ